MLRRAGVVHGGWVKMKQALLILLFTIAPACADNQNVYDFFRQLRMLTVARWEMMKRDFLEAINARMVTATVRAV